jgi:hypothetical protein
LAATAAESSIIPALANKNQGVALVERGVNWIFPFTGAKTRRKHAKLLNFPRLPYWCKPALDIQKSVLH